MAERATQESPLVRRPTPLFGAPGAIAGSEEELHELRVRIPVNLHRQLLSLKVLRGRSLADTVSLALDIYFANYKAHRDAEEAADGQHLDVDGADAEATPAR